MPFPAGRRIAGALAALVLALLGSAMIALPARAEAPVEVASVVGPADGAVVGGTAVTFLSTVPGVGYQFRWATDETVDADGRLSDISGGGQGTVRAAQYELTDLAAGVYYWQVRALDDGAAWSTPRSFEIDPDAEGLQLETYPLDSSGTTPPGLLAGIDGRIWITAAAAFSVVLLAVVFRSAYRSRKSA